jgi:SagB-type dehydrogenase family enzyme
MFKRIFLVAVLLSFALPLFADELKPIKLPPPQLDSGKKLMQALKDRKSERSFSQKKLNMNVLSNLLWAADGINRQESGHRTAPSAVNWQEVAIYLATSYGLFLYEPKEHAIKPVLNQDIRALTGKQAFAAEAPLDLIYVADFSKMGGGSAEEKNLYSAADTGFISQNVYLYCASEGLATVVRGSIDKDVLAKAMKLSSYQRIILAQTVGYPQQ